jgi:hypothetical protein
MIACALAAQQSLGVGTSSEIEDQRACMQEQNRFSNQALCLSIKFDLLYCSLTFTWASSSVPRRVEALCLRRTRLANQTSVLPRHNIKDSRQPRSTAPSQPTLPTTSPQSSPPSQYSLYSQAYCIRGCLNPTFHHTRSTGTGLTHLQRW